mmetsp:Transcript_12904/g.38420  ORF Transcript_12904/g.38420 Transcript_12904/m.38420 type:complete len:300 (+) Transcript_12904:1275-2174(+)
MGGDGGCIATQREFMRGTYGSHHAKGGWATGQNHGAGTTGGDAERGDFTARRRAARVRSCALSNEDLRAPVVADQLGQLFNKLPMLEAISAKELPERFAHIRGLRDLVDVKFAPPPKEQREYVHGEGAPFAACPVTGAALDGSRPFVVARTSGWLLSEAAVAEIGAAGLQAEYGPFEKHDLVAACPDELDVQPLAEALVAKRAEAKARKREAKRARAADGGADALDAEQPQKERKAKVPKVKKPVIKMGAAADVARKAREQTAKDHADGKLGQLFHADGSKTGAADLFIATAPRRYNLN